MAFVESSVVVYLRALFYPDGFGFPLTSIGNHLAATEFFREIATMIMLLSIAIIAGKTKSQRLAYFIYSFAVWDIFYYLFLKIIINWPLTLIDWDLLFLIPFPWVAPVITPVICSLLMIFLALVLLRNEKKPRTAMIRKKEWALLIVGSLVVIVSFTMDFVSFLHEFYSWSDVFLFKWISQGSRLSELFIPVTFPWWVFLLGIGIISTGIVFIMVNSERKSEQ